MAEREAWSVSSGAVHEPAQVTTAIQRHVLEAHSTQLVSQELIAGWW